MAEMEILSRDTCTRLLPREGTGWVTCADRDGRPALRPVDFVLHEREVVFRTCYHDEVAQALQEPWVTVGVARLDETLGSGWWVTVSGQARLVGDDLVNPGLPHRECRLAPGDGLLVGVPLTDVRGYRLDPPAGAPLEPRAAPVGRRLVRGLHHSPRHRQGAVAGHR